MAAKKSGAWTGFVVFAGTMLLVIGGINVFQGFIALFDDEHLVVTPDNLILVDLTGWGWVLLISGLIMIAAGLGLLAAQTWARITAIVIVIVHAIIQIAWLGAYPVWSLLMIALDTVVLYALTAGWSDVRERLKGLDEETWQTPQEAGVDAGATRTTPMP
ncbi:hypothetical protein [Kribbella sp. VKM Ac-2568]|uniref:DUF7144 family membrane protein n=1 Tax=Kribbella sp. VKM Ac-2568 TaxID=2512219 RepID=UPI00104FED7E|nr:hypothetical protein [Kribbella sp. VKM Ac-2568]TCM51239.1 hypothetical protein EV648_10166 [Kribbella sp. VKM Ac-2568]